MKFNLRLVLLFLLISTGVYAQQIKVSGTVISAEDKEPVIGASVIVKGNPSIGATTDVDGKFTLTVPASAKLLVVSYISMKTEEVPVKEQIYLTLQPDAKLLGEVEIVSTGYQKVDRRLFTGAAERIAAGDANIDGMADLSKSLQGRSAGVSVQSVSGTFGAAPKLQIRGSSSMLGSQSPLWVVDGVILEDLVQISADELSSGDPATIISSAVAGLNADDIENFQILKDASATALYGAKAMNGVIVITTKRGKTGSVAINYTGEFTTRLIPSYRDYNLMNSQEQMGVYRELEKKGWLNYSDITTQSNSGLYGYMYGLIEQYDPKTKQFALENTPAARANYLRNAEMINTNWFKELFQISLLQNHSVSMSSGSEKNKNYASLSLMDDPGWSIADKVQRFTGNFNSTTNISKTLAVSFKANGSIRKQHLPGTLKRDADAASGEIRRDFDFNPFSYALNTSRTLNPAYFYRMNYAPFNEKHEVKNNVLDIKNSDISFQIDLSWNPIKELELSALGSYRYAKSVNQSKIYESSNVALAYRAAETSTIADKNKFLYRDPDHPRDLPTSVLPQGGFNNMQEYDINSYYSRFMANFNKTFNEKHLTNFLLGAEQRAIDRSDSFNYGYGYQWMQGGTPFIDYRIIKKNQEGNFDYYGYRETVERALAGFATASYSYLGKYTGTVTGRMDGTNQLGKAAKDKWLPTWTVSGGWKIKEENFLKDNKTITLLSLRGTYGKNAKPAPPQANALIILKNGVTFRPSIGEKESMIYIASNQNDELTWEKQTETNIGLDLGLWNRVSLILDAYNREGYDILWYVRTSGIGGQFYKLANSANMNSKGFEFSLGGRAIKSETFNWDANLTFAYCKTNITTMDVNPNIFDLIAPGGNYQVGYPSPSLFSLKFAGLTEKGYPQVVNEKGEVTVGNVFFQSITGLENLVYEGPIDAPYQGGFNNAFSYKNWKFNVFLTYQFGGVLRLDPFFRDSYSDLDVMPKEMKNRWMVAGDELVTTVPVIPDRVEVSNNDLATAYTAYNYSTERVAASDYIRLKEIYLAYDVPASFTHKLSLNTAQLKLTASNLLLLYADKRLNGQDPEFVRAGGVALPNPRQLTLTLRIGL